MFRYRRYRVFLICATVLLVLLFQISRNSSRWEATPSSIYDSVRPPSSRPKPDEKYAPLRPPDKATEKQGQAHNRLSPETPSNLERTIKLPQLKTSDQPKAGYRQPTPTPPLPTGGTRLDAGRPNPAKSQSTETTTRAPATVPDRKQAQADNRHNGGSAQGADMVKSAVGEQSGLVATTSTAHWQKVSEHFPVPEKSIIPLPTGTPKRIPTIQYQFGKESDRKKAEREARLDLIKFEGLRAWRGYKRYAWAHDEVTPITKQFRDPFCGWAATLVDALDTLWIMGLKEEFDEAVTAVEELDFTTSPYRPDIPVFETIIRYLGGLLGAYDVSGGHSGRYRSLLNKAIELAEILMGVFDTPNRMPILYYNWQPAFASQPARAANGASVAELGSMSMEFTRLAQLTGKDKYYDAIARITDALEDLQNRGTTLDGIFPQNLDASGCNRTAMNILLEQEASRNAKEQIATAGDVSNPKGYTPGETFKPKPGTTYGPLEQDLAGAIADAGSASSKPIKSTAYSDQLDDGTTDKTSRVLENDRRGSHRANAHPPPVAASGMISEWDCPAQPLMSSGSVGFAPESYGMGGSQDSAYEYFPKQFLLLGGLVPKYGTMHKKVAKAVKKYLLYKPMIKEERDILFSAKAWVTGGSAAKVTYEYEITHLTCFLGGMFALGGKIFEMDEDVEIGKKLADGCVWAYEAMPTGIMPEASEVVACALGEELKTADCRWNESFWHERLDQNGAWRADQMEEWTKNHKVWEQEIEMLKRKGVAKKSSTGEDDSVAAAVRGETEESQRHNRHLDKTKPAQEDAGDSGSSATSGESKRRDGRPNVKAPPPQKRSAASDPDPTAEDEARVKLENRIKKIENLLEINSQSGRQNFGLGSSSGQIYLGDGDNEIEFPPEPVKPQTHEEYVDERIQLEHLPPGFTGMNDRRYILRPEAIESVWYMFRITGDDSWREKGWRMFVAIIEATTTPTAHSGIEDVSVKTLHPAYTDSMESFWLAETLKYFYLLFAEPNVISLDEWVLNTEAHPFRRPT